MTAPNPGAYVPVQTQAPVKDKFEGWPPGAYEFKPGVFYFKHLSTNAGPFSKPEEAWAWIKAVEVRNANLEQVDRETANTKYEGLFPAKNFILGPGEGREAAFIYAANKQYWMNGNADTEFIYRRAGLFSGMHADIARLINYGEQEQIYEHKNYQQTMNDFPDTPLKQAVMKFF